MHLVNDGWIVIRIGYDDLLERPKVWQQLLLQYIGRIFGSGGDTLERYSQEREIVRLAMRLERPVMLPDVQRTSAAGIALRASGWAGWSNPGCFDRSAEAHPVSMRGDWTSVIPTFRYSSSVSASRQFFSFS